MTTGSLMTFIGCSILIVYIIMQIFNFYGVGQDVYGIYLAFLVFILLSIVVLPNKNPEV